MGGNRTIRTVIRFIAATNRDLKAMVEEHRFRADLYYRLHVFPLNVPPLRDRREDIPMLTRYFVQKHARRLGWSVETIPTSALQGLTRYDWPGKIRELQNVIERSVVVSRTSASEVERERILQTLKDTHVVVGGQDGAAARLGLKRTTLQSRMRMKKFQRQFR